MLQTAPGYRQNGTGDLLDTFGRHYKVWDSGVPNWSPAIHKIPIADTDTTVAVRKYYDFPVVIIDAEPYRRWPENHRSKGTTSIIPQATPQRASEPAGSAGSPAQTEGDKDSVHDSGRSSPASSRSASPASSVRSVVDELALSSSEGSRAGSETPELSHGPSDNKEDRASGNESAGSAGENSGNDDGDVGGGENQATGGGNDGDDPGSGDDSSSDSDNSSDDGGGASDEAQHLEEVYNRVLRALHKTARIMNRGYRKAIIDIQGVVQQAVREATQPDRAYIQATTNHLGRWGEALIDMLSCEGNAEERARTSRLARLAGLKCVDALLKEGRAYHEAEEQRAEGKLWEIVQSAQTIADKRANKTFLKVIKRIPGIIRRYIPDGQAGSFIAAAFNSMGDHQLSLHGKVSTQVVMPYHVATGTYYTSGNIFRAFNYVVPGLQAAAFNYRPGVTNAQPGPPAATNQGTSSQVVRVSEVSESVPLNDTPTGRPEKQGRDGAGASSKSAERPTGKKQSGQKAPLMDQAKRDFKVRESKIQTGGTPGSRRDSGRKKCLDSDKINKTWQGFEQQDREDQARDQTRDKARRVLEMNAPAGTLLSITDHEEMDIQLLTERDAPVRAGTSGEDDRKRKFQVSTDEDEEPAGSRRKKRKKAVLDDKDPFDSDYKEKLSFKQKKPVAPASSSQSARPDDDSGFGSLSEPKKPKKDTPRKPVSTGDAKALGTELKRRKESSSKAQRDQLATTILLSSYRKKRYALETDTMKAYRSQNVHPDRAGCENNDDHSAYLDFVRKNNKQSYICENRHLLRLDEYFTRVQHKIETSTGGEKKDYQEAFTKVQRTLGKKVAGIKGRTSDAALAQYLIRVLRSTGGTIIDASHIEWRSEQNLGLHGLLNAEATTRVTRGEKVFLYDGSWGDGHIEHGFCPLCLYASGGHWALSNHIRVHFRLGMYCGYCYYVSTSTDDMLNHSEKHDLQRKAPLNPEKKKKKKK